MRYTMKAHVRRSAPRLMRSVFKKIFPEVKTELMYWKKRAKEIPNKELREQALASIDKKKFHCQGGSVYSVLANENWKDAVRFIVAYQTISDYLDNLCDRSTSLDPVDFRMLHQSMKDALDPEQNVKNYYYYRAEQEDGNYLAELVTVCQNSLTQLAQYPQIKEAVQQLEQMYSDLQVHKHVKESERIERLKKMHQFYQEDSSDLTWYEFSAASGSTLGIFCLVSYAMAGKMTERLADQIFDSYFPFMQGLHILLDYYIDQQEDKEEGDLNFCSYYKDRKEMEERLLYFVEQTNKHVKQLPDRYFHEMIHNGLVALYLADPKVMDLEDGKKVRKLLIKASGRRAAFFHWNIRLYYRYKDKPIEA